MSLKCLIKLGNPEQRLVVYIMKLFAAYFSPRSDLQSASRRALSLLVEAQLHNTNIVLYYM